MNTNYKSNSHKSKSEQNNQEERPKVEKVISGTARTKKKGPVKKLVNAFLAEDIHNVKSLLVSDVLIPAAKKVFFDVITRGADMFIYGGTGGGDRRRPNASKVTYRDYYERRNDDRRPPIGSNQSTRSVYDYDEVILDTRTEAEEVLLRMDEIIKTYGVVTVADLYDLVGISDNYTDHRYGWTNIRNAKPERVRDGYILNLPKALPID